MSRNFIRSSFPGAHYNRFGFSIRRLLTDNGSCYKDWRFRKLLHRQHVKHRFTRPYTPRTNGKAERFIQTALREWAYAPSYHNSEERLLRERYPNPILRSELQGDTLEA